MPQSEPAPQVAHLSQKSLLLERALDAAGELKVARLLRDARMDMQRADMPMHPTYRAEDVEAAYAEVLRLIDLYRLRVI